MHSILITTECVADLPEEILEKYDIDIIYFEVETDSGLFLDTLEIDARNIVEYMEDGKRKAASVVPTPNDYKNFFNKRLEKYDEIIHICISEGISVAYNNAVAAKSKMGIDGRKVSIINSKSLSSSQGLLAIKAAKLRDDGYKRDEIVDILEDYVSHVSTTFLAYNADYLYYNNKVDKLIMNICNVLHLHPLLYMDEEGKLKLKKVYIGEYDRALKSYINSTIRNNKDDIDENIVFIAYVGCTEEKLKKIKGVIEKKIKFEEVYTIQASATVSCNCGPNTFGIFFSRK